MQVFLRHPNELKDIYTNTLGIIETFTLTCPSEKLCTQKAPVFYFFIYLFILLWWFSEEILSESSGF